MKLDFVQTPKIAALTLISVLALASAGAFAKDVKVNLTGAEETPPVTTSASGHGTIHIAKDKSVSGSVKTTGMEGTAAHIHVGAKGEAGPPIITLTKEQIIQKGMELGAPLNLTWSCYQSEDVACGVCDSCALRLRGFQRAGLEDPIPYATRPRYD